jgi:hypothetical protein
MEREVVRALRSEIPREHCSSNDTRLVWLWNQRLATVQSIYARSRDLQSKMAASLVLTAAMTRDLGAIELLLQRLEGSAVTDEEVLEASSLPL